MPSRSPTGRHGWGPLSVLTPQGRDLAAVWACGDGAVLFALSATLRCGLLRDGPPQPQVLVQATGRRAIEGIDLRTTVDLPPTDVTVRERIPITTVERTILDLAASDLSDRAVESAAAQAERDGRFRRPAQLRVAARTRHRTGAARLRSILRIGPRLWRSEVDGGQHNLPLQRGRDRDRDAALARAGWTTVRVSAAQVRDRPDDVVRTVATALRLQGWGRSGPPWGPNG